MLLPMKVFILTRRRRVEGQISPNEACRPARKALIVCESMSVSEVTLPEPPEQVSASGLGQVPTLEVQLAVGSIGVTFPATSRETRWKSPLSLWGQAVRDLELAR